MPIVSITRLEVRPLALTSFFRLNLLAFVQAAATPCFIKGRAMINPFALTFWTMTLWESEQAMKAYRNSGDHLAAMRRLNDLARAGAVVHWEQEGTEFPSFAEARRHLLEHGTFTKIQHPSRRHRHNADPANPDKRLPAARGLVAVPPPLRKQPPSAPVDEVSS